MPISSRAHGINQFAGQTKLVDVTCADHAAQKDQNLHGKHADLCFRQAEARVIRNDDQIAKRHQSHAAGNAISINSANQRHS